MHTLTAPATGDTIWSFATGQDRAGTAGSRVTSAGPAGRPGR